MTPTLQARIVKAMMDNENGLTCATGAERFGCTPNGIRTALKLAGVWEQWCEANSHRNLAKEVSDACDRYLAGKGGLPMHRVTYGAHHRNNANDGPRRADGKLKWREPGADDEG